MSEPLRLFEVTLALWERDSGGDWEKSDSTVTILTFAIGFESARKLAASSYKEADQTDEDFEWRALSITERDDIFVIPKTNKVLPKPR